jgi:uncharacterized protein YkwD
MNYIDVLILLVLVYHVVRGYYIGFWSLFARLISFFAAMGGALYGYKYLGDFISSHFNTLPAFSYGIGFVVCFILIQALVSFAANTLFNYIPPHILNHKASKIAGLFPGALDGLILISLILLVLLISPTPASLRNDIHHAMIGGYLANTFSSAEQYGNKLFGGAIERSLSLLTTEPESEGSVKIPYKPSQLTADSEAELIMLELVNKERAKAGAPALYLDPLLVKIARAHSEDMWKRSYFSHVDPDGNDPFARMRAGGAKFLRAGENIALAPNVEVSHKGLMNSPGHKRNILDPNFRKVGIGIIDGGLYGQMYTQDFSD